DEPFGPLAPITPFKDFDSVMTEANRLDWGLAAYAYTRNTRTAAAVGAAFESGMVSINHHGLALPEVPFGGMKDSGYGSEGGTEALEAYLNTKFVTTLGMERSIHLGAGGDDHRRQLLFVGPAERGGVGGAQPQQRGAQGEVGSLQRHVRQGLLAERRGLLDDDRRHAGGTAQAAP